MPAKGGRAGNAGGGDGGSAASAGGRAGEDGELSKFGPLEDEIEKEALKWIFEWSSRAGHDGLANSEHPPPHHLPASDRLCTWTGR